MSDQRAIIHLVDTISAAAVVGTLANLFPPLAALAGLIWYLVQIWESKTVQSWIHRKDPPSIAADALHAAEARVEKLADNIHTLAVTPPMAAVAEAPTKE